MQEVSNLIMIIMCEFLREWQSAIFKGNIIIGYNFREEIKLLYRIIYT